MKSKTLLAAAVAALATPALATSPAIESVDVTFDETAIESPAAAAFWADLEGDLEAAILARLASRLGEDGAQIAIDIDEFDMSNSFQAALGADSTLAADVDIDYPDDPSRDLRYTLTVTLEQAAIFLHGEDGTSVVEMPLEAAYATMLDAFADNVVAKLQ